MWKVPIGHPTGAVSVVCVNNKTCVELMQESVFSPGQQSSPGRVTSTDSSSFVVINVAGYCRCNSDIDH